MEAIEVSRDGPVGIITLARPAAANALNAQMLVEIAQALDALGDDHGVRVVLFNAQGKGFCGGHDRKERVGGVDPMGSVTDDHRSLRALLDGFLQIFRYHKPTIAAVHGYCIGAGAQMVACCDLAVVGEDAEIGIAAVPTGAGYLAPSFALSIGLKRAKQLAFDYGSRITGREAAAWGWANMAVPADEVQQAALDLARRVSRAPQDCLYGQKISLNRVASIQGFEEALAAGIEVDLLMRQSAPVQRMRAYVSEHGIKQAMRAFQTGIEPFDGAPEAEDDQG